MITLSAFNHDETYLICAIKDAISACIPEVILTGIDKKLDEALDDFEQRHGVKLILLDDYEVKQSFQELRDECQRVFETEILDAVTRTLGKVQNEFSNQLTELEENLTAEILGE